jgi:hypothetical protein
MSGARLNPLFFESWGAWPREDRFSGVPGSMDLLQGVAA